MIYEQISLGGVPVVGFGETREESEKKFYGTMIGVPLLGLVAGSVGGAMLGKGAFGRTGTAVAGGAVGALAGLGAAILLLGTHDKTPQAQK